MSDLNDIQIQALWHGVFCLIGLLIVGPATVLAYLAAALKPKLWNDPGFCVPLVCGTAVALISLIILFIAGGEWLGEYLHGVELNYQGR
jgi:multisubunit Na+/H+ antiporter MnhB subunit